MSEIKPELKQQIEKIQTNGEFIKLKLINFIKYAKEILISKIGEKKDDLNHKLNDLEKLPITNFIQIVLLEMSPYKSNPSAYIDKLLIDHQLNKSDLKEDEYIKLSRYIDCFITICS